MRIGVVIFLETIQVSRGRSSLFLFFFLFFFFFPGTSPAQATAAASPTARTGGAVHAGWVECAKSGTRSSPESSAAAAAAAGALLVFTAAFDIVAAREESLGPESSRTMASCLLSRDRGESGDLSLAAWWGSDNVQTLRLPSYDRGAVGLLLIPFSLHTKTNRGSEEKEATQTQTQTQQTRSRRADRWRGGVSAVGGGGREERRRERARERRKESWFVGSDRMDGLRALRLRGSGRKRRAQEPTEACQSNAPTATTD